MEEKASVLAVETDIGTRFLMSASPSTSILQLRELIQHGHFSCFPEHGQLYITTVMVENDGKWYRVLDSLLVGQVLSKRKNKVKVEVIKAPFNSSTVLPQPMIATSVDPSNETPRKSCSNPSPVKESQSHLMLKDQEISNWVDGSKMELPVNHAYVYETRELEQSNHSDSLVHALQGNFEDPSLFTQGPCTQPWLNLGISSLHTTNEEQKDVMDPIFTNVHDREERCTSRDLSISGIMGTKVNPQVTDCGSLERLYDSIEQDGRARDKIQHTSMQVNGRVEDCSTRNKNRNSNRNESLRKQELDGTSDLFDINLTRKASLSKHAELENESLSLTTGQNCGMREKGYRSNVQSDKWYMTEGEPLHTAKLICKADLSKVIEDMVEMHQYGNISQSQCENVRTSGVAEDLLRSTISKWQQVAAQNADLSFVNVVNSLLHCNGQKDDFEVLPIQERNNAELEEEGRNNNKEGRNLNACPNNKLRLSTLGNGGSNSRKAFCLSVNENNFDGYSCKKDEMLGAEEDGDGVFAKSSVCLKATDKNDCCNLSAGLVSQNSDPSKSIVEANESHYEQNMEEGGCYGDKPSLNGVHFNCRKDQTTHEGSAQNKFGGTESKSCDSGENTCTSTGSGDSVDEMTADDNQASFKRSSTPKTEQIPDIPDSNQDAFGVNKHSSTAIRSENLDEEHDANERVSSAQTGRNFGEQEMQIKEHVQTQEGQLVTQVGIEVNNSYMESSKAGGEMVKEVAVSGIDLDRIRPSQRVRDAQVNIVPSRNEFDSFRRDNKKKKMKMAMKGRDNHIRQPNSQYAMRMVEEKKCHENTGKRQEESAVTSSKFQSFKQFERHVSSDTCHNLSTFVNILDAMISPKNLSEWQSSGFHLKGDNELAEPSLSLERRETHQENPPIASWKGPKKDQSNPICLINMIRETSEIKAYGSNRHTHQMCEIAIEDNNAMHISTGSTEIRKNKETHEFAANIESFQGSGKLTDYKSKRHREKEIDEDAIFVQDGLAFLSPKQDPTVLTEHKVMLDIEKCKAKRKKGISKNKIAGEILKTNLETLECKRFKDMKRKSDAKSSHISKNEQIPGVYHTIGLHHHNRECLQENSILETDPQITVKELQSDKEKVENVHTSKDPTIRRGTKNRCTNNRRAIKKKRGELMSCSEDERKFTLQDSFKYDVTENSGGKVSFDVFAFSSDGGDELQSQNSSMGKYSDSIKNLDKISSKAVRKVLEADFLKVATRFGELQPESISRKCDVQGKWKNRSLVEIPSMTKGSLEQTVVSSVENVQRYTASPGCSINGKVETVRTSEASGGEKHHEQIITEQCQVACPAGCGRVYSKKTSAFYRHKRGCSGKAR